MQEGGECWRLLSNHPTKVGAMFCRHMLACFASACFVVLLPSCRFEPEATQWVETHGEWQFQSLAAWPEGAWASGLDDRVFRYPGGWGEPWNRPLPVTGKLVAGSPKAAFVLGSDSVLRRVQDNNVFAFPNSADWHISAMAAGEDGSLFVVSGGRVRKVAETLETAGCDEEVIAVAVGREAVFFVAKTGQLRQH